LGRNLWGGGQGLKSRTKKKGKEEMKRSGKGGKRSRPLCAQKQRKGGGGECRQGPINVKEHYVGVKGRESKMRGGGGPADLKDGGGSKAARFPLKKNENGEKKGRRLREGERKTRGRGTYEGLDWGPKA